VIKPDRECSRSTTSRAVLVWQTGQNGGLPLPAHGLLRVVNLPHDTEERELRGAFEGYGELRLCHVLTIPPQE
jgi:hypothetical protein